MRKEPFLSLVVIFAFCASANAQDCSQYVGAKARAAWEGNLALVYELDAQEKQCLSQRQQPQYAPGPQYQPPPQNNFVNSAQLRELSALGGFVNRNAVLPQGIPLSSGTVMMQNAPAPPPAPTNYVDPFAARWTPPVSTNSAPHVNGNIRDLNQVVREVPTEQADAPPPPSNPPTTFLNPKNCTFDSLSCR